MNKVFLFIFLFATSHMLFAASVEAACRPIYGGGNMCEQKGKITIEKTIKNSSGSFVDTLTPQDSFAPGASIEFRIVVKNTDSRAIKTITVKDVLPDSVTYISSQGTFDAASRTVTLAIDELQKDESKTLTIQTKANQPTNGICFANLGSVTHGRDTNQDATDFCIGTPGSTTQTQLGQSTRTPLTTKGGQVIYQPQNTTQNPSTGPELLGLIALIPAGAAGLYIRRKTTT